MNKRVLKEFANGVCSIALAAAGLIFREKVAKAVTSLYAKPESYGDAVEAIMNSSLFSDSKREALRLVQKDRDSDYYGSIIKVVNSSAFSDTKLEMLEILNQKGEA